jgi:hypothetical protein
VLLFVLAVISSSEPACSDDQPCGSEWSFSVIVVAWGAVLVLLVWLPDAARFLVIPTAIYVLAESRSDGDPFALLLIGFIILVPATLLACHWVIGRRKAAELPSLPDATETGRWPAPDDRVPESGWYVLAVVLVLAGMAVLVYGVERQRSESEWERTSGSVTGIVTEHKDEYIITVSLPAEVVADFDTYDATDYPVGSPVEVLTQGHKRRLAAEPYDGSVWGALGMGGVVLGGAFALHGRHRRRRFIALIRREQPRHDIGVVVLYDELLVFDSEDVAGRSPKWVLAIRHGAGELGDHEYEAEVDDMLRPEPATLYGWLADGQPAGVVLANGQRFLGRPLEPYDGRDLAEGVEAGYELPTPVTQGVAPVANGAMVSPQGGLRPIGLLLFVGGLAAIWFVVAGRSGAFDAIWHVAIIAGFCATGLELLTSGVEVTDTGLLIKRVLTVVAVPWTAVHKAAVDDDVFLVVTWDDQWLPLFIDWSTISWMSKRRAARTRVLASVLQARIEAERASHPSFIHPNESRIAEQPRWEPGLAAVIFTMVLVLAVRYAH